MTYIALLVSALLVGIDRLTKWLAVTYVKPEHSINLININGVEILNLTYNENRGAAFSILQDKQLFLIIITSVFLLALLIALLSKKIKFKFLIWSLSIILAGGLGNLIDRVFNGYVVDFIDFRVIRFAVFNFADMCAVCGTIMLLFYTIYREIKEYKETNKNKALAEDENDG